MQPPSSYKQIDTLLIAKKHFGFTSNKLEYMSKNLCSKHKKMSHSNFPGFELWIECMKGNKKAWEEMKEYNIYDVLALEELYNEVRKWDSSINFNVYSDDLKTKCNCGHGELQKRGYNYSNTGKFQRYQCTKCGAWSAGKLNLLSKEKRQSLKNR
jgi:hypothetical protein